MCQLVIVFGVHVRGCSCVCLLIRSRVLVCMIAKFTLIYSFTSHDVRAPGRWTQGERAGGREGPTGRELHFHLFSLFNRLPM